MKTTKYLMVLLIFGIMLACEENTSQQDSTADSTAEQTPQEEGANALQNALKESAVVAYGMTNDFQEYNGQQMASAFLYLKSINTGEAYIIPPTQYESVSLTHFIINMKVQGECIEVPAHAFPVMVGVCQSEQCDQVRPLNVVLKQPAHYNLSGIGGLLTPAVFPVSPCSEQTFELVEALQPYQKI